MEQTRTRRLIERSFSNSGMLKLPKRLPGELIDLVLISAMRKHGIEPVVIYAYERTLLWITVDNVKSFSKNDLAAWDAAQAEYWKQDEVN